MAFKDHSFPLTAQKLQASVEGIVLSQSKLSPNIDFKSMTDFSNDMRTLVALTNNALLLTATRELILKEMFSMLDFSSLPDRFTDLFKTTEVLIRVAKKDFGRSVTAQTRILANMELFRRDSVLDKVNKKVSKASVNSLRSSTLLSSSMFEDSIVKEVQDSTERSVLPCLAPVLFHEHLQRALGVALLLLPLLLSSLRFGAPFEEKSS